VDYPLTEDLLLGQIKNSATRSGQQSRSSQRQEFDVTGGYGVSEPLGRLSRRDMPEIRNRPFELFSNLERLLIVCLFRRDPALPTVLITERSSPILRFRMFLKACHVLITSAYVHAFSLKAYSPL
jgi:hypothetical protein